MAKGQERKGRRRIQESKCFSTYGTLRIKKEVENLSHSVLSRTHAACLATPTARAGPAGDVRACGIVLSSTQLLNRDGTNSSI
jgi:hypothetical protein